MYEQKINNILLKYEITSLFIKNSNKIKKYKELIKKIDNKIKKNFSDKKDIEDKDLYLISQASFFSYELLTKAISFENENTIINLEDFLIITMDEYYVINKKDINSYNIIKDIDNNRMDDNIDNEESIGKFVKIRINEDIINLQKYLSIGVKYNIKTKQFFFIIDIYKDIKIDNKLKKELFNLLSKNEDKQSQNYLRDNTTERIYKNNDLIESFVISDLSFLSEIEEIIKKQDLLVVSSEIDNETDKDYKLEWDWNTLTELEMIEKNL